MRSACWVLLLAAMACRPEPVRRPAPETGSATTETAVTFDATGVTGHTGETAAICAPSLVVGVGEESFHELDPGEPVVIVHGPQGGYHIVTAMLICGVVAPVSVHLTIERVADAAKFADSTRQPLLLPVDRCCGEIVDLYGYLSVPITDTAAPATTVADELDHQEVRIAASVVDAGGAELFDEVVATATYPRESR